MTELTPALLALMEQEKGIELGLAGVGRRLLAIRDCQMYRAAGYATFADYCRRRWNIAPAHAYRQITAAETLAALEASPIGDIVPTREGQVRPLTRLPVDERADAWAEAVELAGAKTPTGAQVAAVVERRRYPARREHPAPYSDAILTVIAEQLVDAGPPDLVVDPFAGTGRVHHLRDLAGIPHTIGVELEPEWAAKHPDTICGNALDLPTVLAAHGVGPVDAIVTSPTYGNRMADHHEARDGSVRPTYRHTLDRPLDPDNSGAMQWGNTYRAFHVAAWQAAFAVLRPGGLFTLNVKNHVRDGTVKRVAEWHLDTLLALGLRVEALDLVPTRGLSHAAGANGDARVTGELVVTLRRPSS